MNILRPRNLAVSALGLLPVLALALPFAAQTERALDLRANEAMHRLCAYHLLDAIREAQLTRGRLGRYPGAMSLASSTPFGAWSYEPLGDGARLHTMTPRGRYEVWLHGSGRVEVTGCIHGGHRT